jgi:hypothetical protein
VTFAFGGQRSIQLSYGCDVVPVVSSVRSLLNSLRNQSVTVRLRNRLIDALEGQSYQTVGEERREV